MCLTSELFQCGFFSDQQDKIGSTHALNPVCEGLRNLAVSCLFEQDMRKFSDFDYKNAQNDWNHAEITPIPQIIREI